MRVAVTLPVACGGDPSARGLLTVVLAPALNGAGFPWACVVAAAWASYGRLSARHQHGHLGQFGAVEVALDFEVVVGLDVDPEAVVDAEGLGQA